MEYKYILIDDTTGEVIKQSNDLTELKYNRETYDNTTISQKCDICGKYENIDEIIYYDGNAYCNDCCCENLAYCDHCGKWFDIDTAYSVNAVWGNTETWCENCCEEHAFQCVDCGEWFDVHEYNSIEYRGNLYCDRCSDDFNCCDHCGKYYYYDEGNYCEEYDCWYCDNCYNELFAGKSDDIDEYHERPDTIYYTDNGSTDNGENFKGFGIELEVDANNYLNEQEAVDHLIDTLGDHVYYNRDGSLNHGFEIITQPHTRKALTELPWDTALTELVKLGYLSHNKGTCGLHMHVSRTMFGDNETERTINIAKIIQFYNLFWNDILKFSRRTEYQADRWAERYFGANTKQQAEDIAKMTRYALEEQYNYRARYHAVNLTNKHTVEFRLMRGTLNVKTFKATLDFLMTVAENAKNVTNVTSLKQWFKGIAPETKKYMASRNCFGYTSNQMVEEQGD